MDCQCAQVDWLKKALLCSSVDVRIAVPQCWCIYIACHMTDMRVLQQMPVPIVQSRVAFFRWQGIEGRKGQAGDHGERGLFVSKEWDFFPFLLVHIMIFDHFITCSRLACTGAVCTASCFKSILLSPPPYFFFCLASSQGKKGPIGPVGPQGAAGYRVSILHLEI